MVKKKIIVDLDVVTVSIWDKKGENADLAVKFIDRVEKGEFYVMTPYFMLELISKWKYSQIKDYIGNFYLKFSDEILSNEELDDKFDSIGIDDVKILNELKNREIKGEDALLVVVASAFDAACLITFNRTHLKNNKEIINEVLGNHGLRTIEIIGPEEV
jgi:predicted nucleic acid-binding protein